MSEGYFDKLRLIDAVRERRLLWDCDFEDYKNRDLGEIAWKQISKEIGFPVPCCRRKWYALRDTYRKLLKRAGSGKMPKWRYFKQMEFIKNTFQNNANQDLNENDNFELQDTEEVEIEDMIEIENNKETLREMISKEDGVESHNSTTVPNKRVCLDSEEIDEDYHFLMSILPSMRNLPRKRKNIARTKILQEYNLERMRGHMESLQDRISSEIRRLDLRALIETSPKKKNIKLLVANAL